MSDQRSSFFVGLTGLFALGGLMVMLMLFGELDRVLIRHYELAINTNNAGGLRPGSIVALNGVKVGQISTVSLQDDPEFPVSVLALIERDNRIPNDVSFQIEQALIGGSSLLALSASGAVDGFLPDDDTAQLHGVHESMLEQMSAALVERFDPLMRAMVSFERFADTYRSLGEHLDELLTPSGEGGTDASLHTAVAKLNTLLEQVTTTAAQVDSWLGDDALRTSVTDAAAQLGPTLQRYEQLAETLDNRAIKVATELTNVSDQLGAALEQVRIAALAANSGPGTVSQLLNNPDLYNSLTDSTEQLQRTLVEIDLLIQKFKAEGVSVSF